MDLTGRHMSQSSICNAELHRMTKWQHPITEPVPSSLFAMYPKSGFYMFTNCHKNVWTSWCERTNDGFAEFILTGKTCVVMQKILKFGPFPWWPFPHTLQHQVIPNSHFHMSEDVTQLLFLNAWHLSHIQLSRSAAMTHSVITMFSCNTQNWPFPLV